MNIRQSAHRFDPDDDLFPAFEIGNINLPQQPALGSLKRLASLPFPLRMTKNKARPREAAKVRPREAAQRKSGFTVVRLDMCDWTCTAMRLECDWTMRLDTHCETTPQEDTRQPNRYC